MISLKSLFFTGLAGTAAAIYGLKQPGAGGVEGGELQQQQQQSLPGCGELDIFFTGLPAHHPYVKAIGLDTNMVDRALRSEARSVINAGYNLRVALAGPEIGTAPIQSQFHGNDDHDHDHQHHEWDGTGMGFGMRSMKRDDVTLLMTDELDMFRRGTKLDAPILFNYNATTFLWALKTYLPLGEDCAALGKPGKDLGYTEFCDICDGGVGVVGEEL